MSLHSTPEDHDADPPSGWRVVKVAGPAWHLVSSLSDDYVFASYLRKRDAEAARTDSPHVRLYEREGRWFAGEPVSGWKPYAAIEAERERRAEWLAGREAAER